MPLVALAPCWPQEIADIGLRPGRGANHCRLAVASNVGGAGASDGVAELVTAERPTKGRPPSVR